MTLSRLFEGLGNKEMEKLVSSIMQVDKHKPKTGAEHEVVVVAFTVDYEAVANDLSNFIETGAVEHLDVDVSFSPNENGKYQIFVEFARDKELFKKLEELLYDVTQVTGVKNWGFIAFRNSQTHQFNYNNFNQYIAANPAQYKEIVDIHERMNFLIKY